MTTDAILMDPLRGDVFHLSSYIGASGVSVPQRTPLTPTGGSEFTIAMSKIFVGPPPESASVSGPHIQGAIIIVSNLPYTTTDAQLKKECIEVVGARPKFVYMHVADGKTGMFSGTAVIEFSDESSANKAVVTRLSSCPTRIVTAQEYQSLIMGEWPMLEYGPPQGVFGDLPKVVAPQPAWAQSSRPAAPNPWQK